MHPYVPQSSLKTWLVSEKQGSNKSRSTNSYSGWVVRQSLCAIVCILSSHIQRLVSYAVNATFRMICGYIVGF